MYFFIKILPTLIIQTTLNYSNNYIQITTRLTFLNIIKNEFLIKLLTNRLFTRLHALTRKFKGILREAIIEKPCQKRVSV